MHVLLRSSLVTCLSIIAFGSANAHEQHHPMPDTHAPAGVMLDHMHKAGEWMVGYRHMYAVSRGDTLEGDTSISDKALVAQGYDSRVNRMSMNMGMLDIMYAPTDWLTLMVMPQFVDMTMSMTTLPGASHGGGHGGHSGHSHSAHEHGTFGYGDTAMHALIKLWSHEQHHFHAGLGLNAPTGSVSETGPSGVITHYGMQLGSGTWDFLPSITYTSGAGAWGWGAQFSAIKRLESENATGFRFGDQYQGTGWGSYRLTEWLSTSLRLQYTTQEPIKGHYNRPHNHGSPPDFQRNYGGHLFEAGLGFNSVVTDGPLKGHRLAIEWLQPVYENVNGVQQGRTGALYLNWSVGF